LRPKVGLTTVTATAWHGIEGGDGGTDGGDVEGGGDIEGGKIGQPDDDTLLVSADIVQPIQKI
jgi:hypothetical protein